MSKYLKMDLTVLPVIKILVKMKLKRVKKNLRVQNKNKSNNLII